MHGQLVFLEKKSFKPGLFHNFSNDYYILGGRLYQNGKKLPFHIMF